MEEWKNGRVEDWKDGDRPVLCLSFPINIDINKDIGFSIPRFIPR
jgi:hypothetical protein